MIYDMITQTVPWPFGNTLRPEPSEVLPITSNTLQISPITPKSLNIGRGLKFLENYNEVTCNPSPQAMF